MGIRGELFSSKINCRGRSYFFNVKENRTGDVFLNIVESKPTENAEFDRRSIVVFKEDMREFLQAFEKALRYIDTSPAPKKARRTPRAAGNPDGRRSPRNRPAGGWWSGRRIRKTPGEGTGPGSREG
ncbi:MAG: DUF3276 family protein [Candidatus Moduliflexus flocculans]|nr:DUF3276 family protein [Candidatus Moduliflexus flocculans]